MHFYKVIFKAEKKIVVDLSRYLSLKKIKSNCYSLLKDIKRKLNK